MNNEKIETRLKEICKKNNYIFHPETNLEEEIKGYYVNTKPNCEIKDLKIGEIKRALSARAINEGY
jgi:hypothetical protein